MEPRIARSLWHRLELINAVSYFCAESIDAAASLGLLGFWMGYVAFRAAPLGPAPAGLVEATFYNFHPSVIRRAVPDAWSLATPEACLEARSAAAASSIRRIVPDADEHATALIEPLTAALAEARFEGRPLFAANRDVALSSDPLGALWQLCTTMREQRGDGHIACLVEAGLDGFEAHVMLAATTEISPATLQGGRNISPEEWQETSDRLIARGLLDELGAATERGRTLRARIEQRTDELAIQPYACLGEDGVEELRAGLASLSRPIGASGELRFPNPMALPATDPSS